MAVGALALITYAQVVARVLMGRFALLQEALTEFDGKAWAIFSICVSSRCLRWRSVAWGSPAWRSA